MELRKSLSEIAELVQGEVVGGGHADLEIRGVASLECAGEGHLSFVTDDVRIVGIDTCRASALIVPKALSSNIPQVIVSNPKLAFAKVLSLFSVFPTLPSGISPQSFRETDVVVGRDVTVGPFVYLGRGARLGDRVIVYPGVFIGAGATISDDCVLYPNVTLYPGTQLGRRVLVHAGSVLGSDGFGYVFDGSEHHKIPQVGKLVIEDDVEIGSNASIDRASLDETRIGKGTKIDNLVQVGHNTHLGPLNILCGQVGVSGTVKSGTGVVFGGQVGVGDHVTIPDGVTFGAQSGVIKNSKLEPGQTYYGLPPIKIRESMRVISLTYRLPDLYKRLKSLEKKVVQLLDKDGGL